VAETQASKKTIELLRALSAKQGAKSEVAK